MREGPRFTAKVAGPFSELPGHLPGYRRAALVHSDNRSLIVCKVPGKAMHALAIEFLHSVRAIGPHVLNGKHVSSSVRYRTRIHTTFCG